MDRLARDPRTRSIGGARASRRQLSKLTSDLFAELRPDEYVLWAMTTSQLPTPGLALITTQRLLVLPLISGRRIRQAAAPFRVELGKKRLIGQVLEVTNVEGAAVSLLLSTDDDVEQLVSAAGTGGSSTPPGPQPRGPRPQFGATASRAADGGTGATRPGTALPLGGWRWNRPVLSWQDAEQLAADHMTHLRFTGVLTTPPGRDGGLDVVATTAGAQVKHLATPTGSPDIQRLAGAAHEFTHKLFYATGYTTAGLTQAELLGIALFQYGDDGTIVPINDDARALGNRTTEAAPKRNIFGQLDFEGRQVRVLRWADQIQVATVTPISNRRRKGAKQLAEKEQALQLMVTALALVQDSNNQLYKRRRKERTLEEAETSLKEAARLLRVILR